LDQLSPEAAPSAVDPSPPAVDPSVILLYGHLREQRVVQSKLKSPIFSVEDGVQFMHQIVSSYEKRGMPVLALDVLREYSAKFLAWLQADASKFSQPVKEKRRVVQADTAVASGVLDWSTDARVPGSDAKADYDSLFDTKPAAKADDYDSLFGTPAPPPADDYDSLFSSGTQSKAAQDDYDSLFSKPAAPERADYDSLFGQPSQAPQSKVDDLFAAPEAALAQGGYDDLFGAPPKSTPAQGGYDDLFGAPPSAAPADNTYDRLFGSSSTAANQGGPQSNYDDLFGHAAAPIAPEDDIILGLAVDDGADAAERSRENHALVYKLVIAMRITAVSKLSCNPDLVAFTFVLTLPAWFLSHVAGSESDFGGEV
jgi:hypothetical protein